VRSMYRKPKHKITLRKFLALVVLSVFSACLLAEESLSGMEIMQRVNQVNLGDDVSQDVEMILINKAGKEKRKVARSFRKRFGDGPLKETRTVMFFSAPEAVAGTAFLSWDYDDPSKQDKQWLYLPRMNQSKRIAGNDKRLAFMGTDFSHADMALRNIHRYDYKILGTEKLGGQTVWVIEGVPLNQEEIAESGYTRSVLYVRQDNFIVVRAINSVKKGNKEKQLDVLGLDKIGEYWVQKEVIMETRKGDNVLSKTIMRTDNIQFDQGLDDMLFTVRSMENGLKE